MKTLRYYSKKQPNGTWSVMDRKTDAVVDLSGVLLIGFGESLAADMTKMLNLDEAKTRSD
jgi:hypothetical protein